MNIKTYINTTREEVDAKKYNIWIGVSLGNKYFDKENIREYLKWAIEHTKDGVLILVADAIHAINLEVLDGRSPGSAKRRVEKLGAEKLKEIEEVIKSLPTEAQKKIIAARWNEATSTGRFKNNLRAVEEYYKSNKEFRDFIVQSIKEARPDRKEKIDGLSGENMDRLAQYVLSEIPLGAGGVQVEERGDVYNLVIYPGLSMLDKLFTGLNNKEIFPDLVEKLDITNKIAILEAYID